VRKLIIHRACLIWIHSIAGSVWMYQQHNETWKGGHTLLNKYLSVPCRYCKHLGHITLAFQSNVTWLMLHVKKALCQQRGWSPTRVSLFSLKKNVTAHVLCLQFHTWSLHTTDQSHTAQGKLLPSFQLCMLAPTGLTPGHLSSAIKQLNSETLMSFQATIVLVCLQAIGTHQLCSKFYHSRPLPIMLKLYCSSLEKIDMLY